MKNDEGKYWDDVEGKWTTTACDCWNSKGSADESASELHSHVVPLVEEPAPVVVSEDEAEMLKKAKNMINPMHLLWLNELTHNGDSDSQSRLLRAYVNGWTVEKPKRWNVKVPLVAHYIYRVDEGELNIEPDSVGSLSAQFTSDEIEQYGLQDYERVEVSNKGGLKQL